MRLPLLCLVVFSACGPALTLKRLSPPNKVLGTARTVRVEVTPASLDTFPGETARVSEEAKARFSERLQGAGYVVCTEPGCGEGVLNVTLAQVAIGDGSGLQHRPSFAMMDEAMKIVRGQLGPGATSEPAKAQVEVLLQGQITLVQADGAVGYRQSFANSTSTTTGTPAEVLRGTIAALAKNFGEGLSRRTPVTEVQLEGGGKLNRGVEMLHEADWAGATAYFTELTRAQPELDGAWYDLGFALEAQNAWHPALKAYEEAARRDPKPHYQRAVSALRNAVAVPLP